MKNILLFAGTTEVDFWLISDPSARPTATAVATAYGAPFCHRPFHDGFLP